MKRLFRYIFLIILLCLTFSCHRNNQDSIDSLEILDEKCGDAVLHWDYDKVDSIADQISTLSQIKKDPHYQIKALYYKGTFRPDLPPEELNIREESLLKAEKMAVEQQDIKLLAIIYNSKAIWETVKHHNYPLAQYYLSKAIEYARETDDGLTETSAEANHSEICRLLGDTLGHKYDLDLFNQAIATNNSALLLSSAYHCSRNLIISGCDLEDLKPFIDAIKKTEEDNQLIPLIYAEYWFSKQNYKEAMSWIEKTNYKNSYIEAILFAEIAHGLGRYKESNNVALEVINQYRHSNFDDRWIKMYNIVASNYAAMNLNDSAYRYLYQYNTLMDSVYSKRNQDKISQLKIEYEVDKKDREIKYQKERSNRVLLISIGGGLVGLFIIIMAFLYIRKRNRLFREIVRQNREHYKIEENHEEAPSVNIMSKDKADEIYDRIKEETEKNEIWRSPNVTRESLADKVGCNRTYLTEVIKLKTGKSYSQYMNQFRIKEALRLLSNPELYKINLQELAKEAGFTSFSNFHSLFKQSVGMSPSAYIKAQNKIMEDK